MRILLYLTTSLVMTLNSCAQQSREKAVNKPTASDLNVGAGCEGCEAIYESPEAHSELNNIDTIPGFENGPRLCISGIIYRPDGKTPASDVVLYVYHTDQKGIYATKGNETGWGKRHGYMRGWIKTGADGSYTFYTSIPASYPNSNNPKHIHPTIKEPGKTAYWIDEFVFDDDPLLPHAERTRANPVGGSGLLKTVMKDGMAYARRDIILGMNVKQYPQQRP